MMQVSAKAQCDGQLTMGLSLKLLKGKYLRLGLLSCQLCIMPLTGTGHLPRALTCCKYRAIGNKPRCCTS